ncbi:hypothetical protein ACN1JM_000718 [Bacillus pacificus]
MFKSYRVASKKIVKPLVLEHEKEIQNDDELMEQIIKERLIFLKKDFLYFEKLTYDKKRKVISEAIHQFIGRLIAIELIIHFFIVNFPKTSPTFQNIWSILPNYDSILPKIYDAEALDVLRVYFKNHFTKPTFEDELKRYLDVPAYLRVFELNQENEIFMISSELYEKRKPIVQELLQKETIFRNERNFKNFVKEDDEPYFYFSLNGNKEEDRIRIRYQIGDKKTYGFHPGLMTKTDNEIIADLDRMRIPKKRKKIPREYLTLKLSSRPWQHTAVALAKEYTKKFPNHIKPRDMEAAQDMFFVRNVLNKNVFEYQDSVSVVGPTGVGKSTFLLMEILRITNLSKFTQGKTEDGKVAVWTENVLEALMLVYRLYEVAGVRAVPIIGKLNKDKHLKDFVNRVKKECLEKNESPISKLASDPAFGYVLQFFKGECSLEIMEQIGKLPRKPCTNIKVQSGFYGNGKPDIKDCVCPLYDTCGMYIVEEQLAESKVWIGTEKAFINSKPLPLVNPAGLTFAEIAYTEMDVIFVDEADTVQSGVEDSFNSKNDILGNEEEAIFEKSFIRTRNLFDTNYMLSGSDIQSRWIYHTNQANFAAHVLMELTKNSKYIRNKITNKSFDIYTTSMKITETIFEIPDNFLVKDHPLCKLLSGMRQGMDKLQSLEEINESDRESAEKLEELFEEISRIKGMSLRIVEINEAIDNKIEGFLQYCISKCDTVTTPIKLKVTNTRDIHNFFYYLLVLIKFDFHFKKLIDLKHSASELLDEEIEDINSSYTLVKRYLPFIAHSPTGKHFQYFYKENDKKKTYNSPGTLQSYNYLGVGREFLVNFGNLYNNLLGKGPSMVFMSATMFAEGSMHYHIDTPINYVLEPQQAIGEIEQLFYPVYEYEMERDEDGCKIPINVSGEINDKQKLSLMTEKLIPKIRDELFRLKKEKRKVLLVVNSYSQVEAVYKILISYFDKEKVGYLKQNNYNIENELEDDNGTMLSEVEKLALKGIEIFIVPLMTINRGYNILKYDENNQQFESESYFGTVFFMVRPFIPYGDISNVIRIINGTYSAVDKKNQLDGRQFYSGVSYIREKSYETMGRILRTKGWASMEDEDRRILGWYTLINILQMIGRLMRGQTSARVYYVDGKFAPEQAKDNLKYKDTAETSMLHQWLNNFESASDVHLVNQLYGHFIKGLKKMLVGGKAFEHTGRW